MRVNRRRFRIEELEARDVPATIGPIIGAHAVAIATPDHAHAAMVRQFAEVGGKANFQDFHLAGRVPQAALTRSSAATIGPIIDTRAGERYDRLPAPVTLSFSSSFTASGVLPMESLSLNFSKVEVSF